MARQTDLAFAQSPEAQLYVALQFLFISRFADFFSPFDVSAVPKHRIDQSRAEAKRFIFH